MDELPQLRTRWEKFEIMMESHQMMVKDQVGSLSPSLSLFHATHTKYEFIHGLSNHQMQVMCSRVEGEVQAFVQEVDKFSARWDQLKPKADILDGDREGYTSALASLKDRRKEFDELVKMADKLKLVCIKCGWCQ